MKRHAKMNIPFLITILCLLIAGLFMSPSHARAGVDAQGAEHLRSLFETYLLTKQKELLDSEQMQLKMDGPVVVEPSDGYYAVTMPYIGVESADGDHIDIGIVAMNIMPGDTPDQWKVTLALPSPITFDIAYGGEGDGKDRKEGARKKRTLTLAIGKQYFAGIWHEKFGDLTKVDARYGDISINIGTDVQKEGVQKENVSVRVADLSITQDITQAAEGNWSGPSDMTVAGLDVEMPDGGNLRVGKIFFGVSIHDYSVGAEKTYEETLAALDESYGAGEASGSVQHVVGIYDMLTAFMGEVCDGLTLDMTGEDILMTRPPIPGSPAGEIAFSKLSLDFGVAGFRKGSVMLHAAAGYDGFSFKPLPKDLDAATVPIKANIDLSLNKLPYAEIVNLGKTYLEGAAKAPPEALKLVGLQALLSMPQVLTQAGTTLDIKNTGVSGGDYSLLMNANINVDINAPKGATGKGRIEVAGLEKVIAGLNAGMSKPDLEQARKDKLRNAVAVLTALQMAGQVHSDATGKPVRIYDIEINKQGAMLLNGQDMTPLLQNSGKQENSNGQDSRQKPMARKP